MTVLSVGKLEVVSITYIMTTNEAHIIKNLSLIDYVV